MKTYLLLFLSLFLSELCFRQQTNLSSFIPAGWSILDTAKGDLNQDGIKDYIMILKNNKEADDDTSTMARPLLILQGQKGGKLILIAKNDHVVLCYHCGGVFGDPYDGIVVKNSFFSIQHYGGASEKWTRIITFKYDPKTKTYVLHKDGGDSFSPFEPEKKESFFYNKEHWDKMKFIDYISD